MPGSFQGITLGRRVFLVGPQPQDGTSALIAHELVHVEQWADRGVLGFSRWYLTDFARELRSHRKWMPAYRRITAEVEARQGASQWRGRLR